MKTPKAFDEIIAQLESGEQCKNCPHQRLLALLRELKSELYPNGSGKKPARRNGNGNGNGHAQPEPELEPEPVSEVCSPVEDCAAIGEILDEIEQATIVLRESHPNLERRIA